MTGKEALQKLIRAKEAEIAQLNDQIRSRFGQIRNHCKDQITCRKQF